MDRPLKAAAALAVAALLAPALPAADLRFADDLGAEIAGLEVCFWRGPARRCSEPAPGDTVAWPARATALRAEGPGHGPVWIEPAELPAGGVVVVPRKAELTLAGVPAGAALDFYRARDPVFRVPLERLRVIDPRRPVAVPAGAVVLAIGAPGRAPDLHRLDAPPGGRAAVRYTPRAGWSGVVRTTAVPLHRPLPGAWVRLLVAEPTAPAAASRILATVRAAQDGLVLLSGVEAPMAVLEALHPDYAPEVARGVIAPVGGLVYQELGMRPGGSLAARLRWRGEPAAEVRWEVYREPADPRLEVVATEVVRRGRADTGGRTTLEHLPEGRYLLRVRPPAASGHVDLPFEIGDRRVSELAADLGPRTVRGTVTRAGLPVPGYRLQARALWPGGSDHDGARLSRASQGDAVTDERGEYALTVLAEGRYAVALATPAGASVSVRAVQVGAEGAAVDYRLEEEAVSGRVVSARGGAIAGAQVSLRWTGSGVGTVERRATSGEHGDFELPLVAPGRGRVAARKPGFRAAEAEVAVPADGLPSEVDLVLEPLATLRGRVVSADGEPLSGVWLASCLDAPDAGLEFLGAATSGPDGGFELPAAETAAEATGGGALRVFASGPGCPLTDLLADPPPGEPTGAAAGEPEAAGAGPATDAPGRAPELVVRCDTEPSVLRLHLAFSASHPLAGEAVVLRRAKDRVIPREVLEGHLGALGLPRVTGPDGELLLVLAPGVWEVYQADRTDTASIRSGSHQGRLGSVGLDPRTVTDLHAGAGER